MVAILVILICTNLQVATQLCTPPHPLPPSPTLTFLASWLHFTNMVSWQLEEAIALPTSLMSYLVQQLRLNPVSQEVVDATLEVVGLVVGEQDDAEGREVVDPMRLHACMDIVHTVLGMQ